MAVLRLGDLRWPTNPIPIAIEAHTHLLFSYKAPQLSYCETIEQPVVILQVQQLVIMRKLKILEQHLV